MLEVLTQSSDERGEGRGFAAGGGGAELSTDRVSTPPTQCGFENDDRNNDAQEKPGKTRVKSLPLAVTTGLVFLATHWFFFSGHRPHSVGIAAPFRGVR